MHEHSRVTYHELIQRLNDPWLAVVDVLPEESYGEAHIPGAISLPLPEIRVSGRSILRDLNREIVVYCAGPASTLSVEAVVVLKELGYQNVRRLEEGLSGWKKNGGAVERHVVSRAAAPKLKKKSAGLSRVLVMLEKSSFLTLLGAWLGMVAIFGLIYATMPMVLGSDAGLKENGRMLGRSLPDLMTALYFSFVTATSVGFGDVVPVGPIRIFAVLESGLELLLFGVIVTKLVQSRQEELIEETHRIAFEDRLARVRTNLHFVLMELQQIEAECHNRAFAPDRIMPRIESVIMVFVGELKSIYDLLRQSHETPMDTILESMLASLTANLRQLRDLLDRSPEGGDSSDSFAALAFNAVLNPHLKSIHRLAEDICSECMPRDKSPELKYWLNEIESLSQF
jgi:rhodanese-related sulfurtransferase